MLVVFLRILTQHGVFSINWVLGAGCWVLQVSELERSQCLIKQHINQTRITFNAQLKTVVPRKNISLPFA